MLEDVNGIVIGPITRHGRLYYQGRPQCEPLWAETFDELKTKAENRLSKLKDECGEAFSQIFPTNEWELREYLD